MDCQIIPAKERRDARPFGKADTAIFPSILTSSIVLAVLTLIPLNSEAAKQRTPQKPVVRGKQAPVPVTTQTSVPAARLTKVQAHRALLRQPSPQPIDFTEKRELVSYRVRSGETLSNVLIRHNVSKAESLLWSRSMIRNVGSEVLPAGKEAHLYFSKSFLRGRNSATQGQLKAVEIDQNESVTLTMEKGIRGIFVQRREKPYDVELKTVSAAIENSLFDDGRKAGIHPALLSQLADLFTWDVDLEKEVRKGDNFRILYEQRSRKGQESKTGLRILAAELNSAGQKYTAVYFERQNGVGGYYNQEGRSLARSFLRFPLEFSAITSHFTESRFHPILRTNLPHTGVDFAAQRGTPVRSVGDGIIAEAGWNGGYGKAIDIKHDATYSSRYAHLDSFAEGIQPGVSVTKGQVIGFVGSTGRSTGPHLHFELYKDQQYINPLSIDFPAEDQLEPAMHRLFENQMRTYMAELKSTPLS
jgi:murein DD-endopeptidase MepM/ murein hydrolase activator NlpD